MKQRASYLQTFPAMLLRLAGTADSAGNCEEAVAGWFSLRLCVSIKIQYPTHFALMILRAAFLVASSKQCVERV